jgi:hypothetical protein
MEKFLFDAYGLFPIASTELIKTGLINLTWKVTVGETRHYIVQQVNRSIFKDPSLIDKNTRNLKLFLNETDPDYPFLSPIAGLDGRTLYLWDEGYYRCFDFVEESIIFNTCHTAQQAYEAAKQFGLFTSKLQDFDVRELSTTLPDFHNLTMRYDQFLKSLKKVENQHRMAQCSSMIMWAISEASICDCYEKFIRHPDVTLRAQHHDTKISNVLFRIRNNASSYNGDKNTAEVVAYCVIDLDTVMAGYIFSDVGDAIRTYTSPSSEEEGDYSKVYVREEILLAIRSGYFESTNLSDYEKDHFIFCGKVMIYMQALRFLTDYIEGDIYYATSYAGQNLIRATNQMYLLRSLQTFTNRSL